MPYTHHSFESYSTLFTTSAGLEHAKALITSYKQGHTQFMTPELWHAKKVVDSTLHPGQSCLCTCYRALTSQDTGKPVFLPFRMSCYVVSNLVVTAGMLIPNLSTAGTIGWQATNQSLNVAINASNANKSSPISNSTLVQSYLLAVSASCGVAVGLNSILPRMKRISPQTRSVLGRLVPFAAVASAGALNVFLMRRQEITNGIDVFPSESADVKAKREEAGQQIESLGKSRTAAVQAVSKTALSRVINSTPIMVLPPLLLVRLQQTQWLKQRPGMVLPVNLGLILTTSIFALPLALAVFPQRETISVDKLEPEFRRRGGHAGMVEYNRGI